MPRKVRVNVKTKVNTASIRREQRNNREVIIVPSATLPDNVVMNRILYPADEIAKSFASLERAPAPLGHPRVNNAYVSAYEPESINEFWCGAHNENVRRENGRVHLDKVIDVQFANESTAGRKLIEALNKAIEKEEPIHTSTGIFMEVEAANHDDYDGIARNMVFDHDAILVGEQGAATPEQGVGMMVNSQGKREQVEVINADCCSWLENEIDSMGMYIMDMVERERRATAWQGIRDKVVTVIREALNLNTPKADGLNVNHREDADMTPEQIAELRQGIVKDLQAANSDALKTVVAEAVASAIEPIKTQVDKLSANVDAAEKAEKEKLGEAVVNAGLLEKGDLEGMSINALRKLADKVKNPGNATGLNGQFGTNAGDWTDMDPNAEIDKAEGKK